jgi:hypothetical protein
MAYLKTICRRTSYLHCAHSGSDFGLATLKSECLTYLPNNCWRSRRRACSSDSLAEPCLALSAKQEESGRPGVRPPISRQDDIFTSPKNRPRISIGRRESKSSAIAIILRWLRVYRTNTSVGPPRRCSPHQLRAFREPSRSDAQSSFGANQVGRSTRDIPQTRRLEAE